MQSNCRPGDSEKQNQSGCTQASHGFHLLPSLPVVDSHPWLASLPFAVASGALLADVDIRERVKQSKNIEEPQDDANNHDCVQDGFDAARHGDETIHQPKQDAHNDQGYENFHERHSFLPFCLCRETLPRWAQVLPLALSGGENALHWLRSTKS